MGATLNIRTAGFIVAANLPLLSAVANVLCTGTPPISHPAIASLRRQAVRDASILSAWSMGA